MNELKKRWVKGTSHTRLEIQQEKIKKNPEVVKVEFE